MSLEGWEPEYQEGYRSMGAGRVTPRDLRNTAKAIRAGRVRRSAGGISMEKVISYPFRAINPQARKPHETTYRVTHRTRILEANGYAVVGPDDLWVLTAAGDEWLDAELAT